ncbi:HlyIII-domain-containing protein [Zopfia rhizophila CBS 207.26]|uniref:HlyIII-domain-containing protein n=1 Tax=Zopfia rhizophila CBS 207.26 TaxID=1314779 RepID=A0A6A6E5C5_9PEZI|nr:HlyIII-domain-containing protein [Zopfia rhizophila CBS 207.26]
MGKELARPIYARRPSKPQSEDNLLEEQIQRAVQITRGGQLLDIITLPKPWRINPFILHGYTFAISIPECIHNALRLSNESFNIWSHLFGVFSVLYLALYHYPSHPIYARSSSTDNLIIGIYFMAATLCLSCSVFWHTMKCHCNRHFMMNCASVDLSGVTIMISAMNVVTQYTAFYCSPSTQRLYLTLTCLTATASLLIGWSPKIRHPDLAWVRVIAFTLLGVVGLLPMAHLGIVRGWGWAWTFYRSVWGRVVAPIFSGAWIYAGKVPERWYPGKFDFLGHSHNVWHLAVLMTILGCYGVGLELLGMARMGGRCGIIGV